MKTRLDLEFRGARVYIVRGAKTENGNSGEEVLATAKLCQELYFRLSGLTLRLPPLRERQEEIGALLGYFIDRFAPQSSVLTLAEFPVRSR